MATLGAGVVFLALLSLWKLNKDDHGKDVPSGPSGPRFKRAGHSEVTCGARRRPSGHLPGRIDGHDLPREVRASSRRSD